MKAPCKDCEKRQLNCHSNCELYNQFKEYKSYINSERKKYLDSRCPAFIAAGCKGKSTIRKLYNQRINK